MKSVFVVFLGIFLSLLGLSLILELLFDVDLPLFKIFVALAAIYLGGNILLNSTGFSRAKKSLLLQNETSQAGLAQTEHSLQEQRFEVHFGKGEVDLSTQGSLPQRIEIYSVCGQATVRLPAGANIRYAAKAIAGEVSLPAGGPKVHLGSLLIESRQPNPITIVANAILATIEFVVHEQAPNPTQQQS